MVLIRPPLIVPDGMMRLIAASRKVPGQGKLSAPKNAQWRSVNLGEELKNETHMIITCRCVTSKTVSFIDALSHPDLQSNLRILATERNNKVIFGSRRRTYTNIEFAPVESTYGILMRLMRLVER